MPVFYGAVDLSKNELRQAQVQNLASAPSSPVLGQIYFNTADATLYCCTNTTGPIWTAAKAGAGATPASTVTTQAVGDAGTVGTGANFAREDHKHGMPIFGSITAQTTYGLSSGNGSSATIARADHTHGTPTHDAAAHSAIPISALATAAGPIVMGSNKIQSLADPTVFNDAATKQYVDNVVSGLSWKDEVRCATTANHGLTGLTAIDGVTPIANDRVLVKNQSTASQNGIYLAASGAWTRTTDADISSELVNAAVFVAEGSTLNDTAWVQTAPAPITVGTTSLTFTQFGSGATYNQGTGITISANTISIDDSVVATDAQVTSAISTALASYATTASLTNVARFYRSTLLGTSSPEVFTHNLNTRQIHVSVSQVGSPYAGAEVDWECTTVNTVTIRYSPNLGAGWYLNVVG